MEVICRIIFYSFNWWSKGYMPLQFCQLLPNCPPQRLCTFTLPPAMYEYQFPHTHTNTVFSDFLIFANQRDERWYLSVVLICIFLIACEAELFSHVSETYLYFFFCLFRSYGHFSFLIISFFSGLWVPFMYQGKWSFVCDNEVQIVFQFIFFPKIMVYF